MTYMRALVQGGLVPNEGNGMKGLHRQCRPVSCLALCSCLFAIMDVKERSLATPIDKGAVELEVEEEAHSRFFLCSVAVGGVLAQVCTGGASRTTLEALSHIRAGIQGSFGAWYASLSLAPAHLTAHRQLHYERTYGRNTPMSAIAFIGGLQIGVSDLACLAAGMCIDRFGPRPVLIFGVLAMTLAHVLLAFTAQLWQVYLCQSVLVSLGEGCFIVGSISVPMQYFENRRRIVITFTTLRNGAGGVGAAPLGLGCEKAESAQLLFALVFHAALSNAGFRVANIAIAAILLVLGTLAVLCLRPRYAPLRSRASSRKGDWRQLNNRIFILFTISKATGALFSLSRSDGIEDDPRMVRLLAHCALADCSDSRGRQLAVLLSSLARRSRCESIAGALHPAHLRLPATGRIVSI